MPHIRNTSNCGVYELYNLSRVTPENAVHFARNYFFTRGFNWAMPGMIMFSDAKTPRRRTETNGERLARFISNNDLGDVTVVPWVVNPNSRNLIQVWMWKPDVARLQTVLGDRKRLPFGAF